MSNTFVIDQPFIANERGKEKASNGSKKILIPFTSNIRVDKDGETHKKKGKFDSYKGLGCYINKFQRSTSSALSSSLL